MRSARPSVRNNRDLLGDDQPNPAFEASAGSAHGAAGTSEWFATCAGCLGQGWSGVSERPAACMPRVAHNHDLSSRDWLRCRDGRSLRAGWRRCCTASTDTAGFPPCSRDCEMPHPAAYLHGGIRRRRPFDSSGGCCMRSPVFHSLANPDPATQVKEMPDPGSSACSCRRRAAALRWYRGCALARWSALRPRETAVVPRPGALERSSASILRTGRDSPQIVAARPRPAADGPRDQRLRLAGRAGVPPMAWH
ncbi:hypothetical protein VTN96DRAFT_6194 [Rasamsonia emersonii]